MSKSRIHKGLPKLTQRIFLAWMTAEYGLNFTTFTCFRKKRMNVWIAISFYIASFQSRNNYPNLEPNHLNNWFSSDKKKYFKRATETCLTCQRTYSILHLTLSIIVFYMFAQTALFYWCHSFVCFLIYCTWTSIVWIFTFIRCALCCPNRIEKGLCNKLQSFYSVKTFQWYDLNHPRRSHTFVHLYLVFVCVFLCLCALSYRKRISHHSFQLRNRRSGP